MRIFTHISRFIISTVIFLLPVLCNAETKSDFPSSFPTVKEMIEQLSDYHEEKGTFKVIKEKPLHIQLSPIFYEGQTKEQVIGDVHRSLIYGIYRSFIFTPVNKITVTAIPKEFNRSNTLKYMNEYKVSVSVARKDALDLAKKYLKVSSFSELVTPKKIQDIIYPYGFSSSFDEIYHNDPHAVVSRDRFINELSKKR